MQQCTKSQHREHHKNHSKIINNHIKYLFLFFSCQTARRVGPIQGASDYQEHIHIPVPMGKASLRVLAFEYADPLQRTLTNRPPAKTHISIQTQI